MSHLNRRMQAVIQEAVGWDLRGCRPEYIGYRPEYKKLGKISDAGHIKTKGCMALCICCMPGIEA